MQHLPERDRPSVKARMRKEWRETDYPRALEQLTRLAAELETRTPAPPAHCGKGCKRR